MLKVEHSSEAPSVEEELRADDQMDRLDHLVDAPPEMAAAADLRHVTEVRVTSNGHHLTLERGDVLVICRDPGFRRAGIAHDAVHVYPAGALAPATLSALRHEPQLEIVEVS